METSKHIEIEYQIFGSATSVDLDICFFVTEIGSIEENRRRISQILERSKIESTKVINPNSAVIQNGVVIDCFKGSVDELNNGLFHTYNLHRQLYEKKVKRLLIRDIDLKIKRCVRTIVSYFTRTEKRIEVKKVLRGSLNDKIKFLDTLELGEFKDFGKNGSAIEIYKSIAFQLGQTLGLLNAEEYYTKAEIAENFPLLKLYLNRSGENSNSLQIVLREFTNRVL